MIALLLLHPWPQAGSAPPGPSRPDPRVAGLVAAVSEARLEELLRTLVSFGTRHTLSNQTSATRGIGAAGQWILEEMTRSSPRLRVEFDTYVVAPQGRITREVELRNVMAVLPGRSARRIYVSAHYDSLNLGPRGQLSGNTRPAPAASGAARRPAPAPDPDVDAPGANDNGSGTVLTMELARVFAQSGLEFDATLVFVLWAGEEQGLVGSRAHAQRIAADGVAVEAVFNNDIVGNVEGGDGVVDGSSVRVFSEGPEDSPSRSLARAIRSIAATYVPAHRVRLLARHDRFGRGSDHSSFNQQGYPGVVFREARENYDRQHSARDTFDGVSFPYLARNARVNAAAVAVLALAPPAPRVTTERGVNMLGRGASGYDAALRWTASPGAAGYRIYWREAWAPEWQHHVSLGPATEHVLPGVSIDDYVFGIAAVGPEGHESTISAYVMPPRAAEEVDLVDRP